MTKVYKSEWGEITEAELINETPKGFRVFENWGGGRKYERIYYLNSPNRSSHRSFLDKEQAVNDAQKYIDKKLEEHIQEITDLKEKKRILSTI